MPNACLVVTQTCSIVEYSTLNSIVHWLPEASCFSYLSHGLPSRISRHVIMLHHLFLSLQCFQMTHSFASMYGNLSRWQECSWLPLFSAEFWMGFKWRTHMFKYELKTNNHQWTVTMSGPLTVNRQHVKELSDGYWWLIHSIFACSIVTSLLCWPLKCPMLPFHASICILVDPERSSLNMLAVKMPYPCVSVCVCVSCISDCPLVSQCVRYEVINWYEVCAS